jgi:hypothetical protein
VTIGGAIVTWIFVSFLPSGGSAMTHIAMATNYYCNYNSLHILTQNSATIVTIATKWDSLSHTNSILYVGRNIVQVHLAGGSED